jgi:hypothetical protein
MAQRDPVVRAENAVVGKRGRRKGRPRHTPAALLKNDHRSSFFSFESCMVGPFFVRGYTPANAFHSEGRSPFKKFSRRDKAGPSTPHGWRTCRTPGSIR